MEAKSESSTGPRLAPLGTVVEEAQTQPDMTREEAVLMALQNMNVVIQGLRSEMEQIKASATKAPRAEVLEETEEPDLSEPSRPRRKSYFANPMPMAELKSTKTTEVANTHLLHVQQGVEDRILMSSISVAAARYLVKIRQYFVNKFSQLKSLVSFIRDDVLTELVDNEQRLGTALGQFIDHENVKQIVEDKVILGMLALHIRTHNMIERDDFNLTILSMTKKLTAKDDDWVFGIKHYDIQLHGAVCKFIRQYRQGWKFINMGATTEQTETWPLQEVGHEKEPGTLAVIHSNLGVFAPAFERQIGRSVMKGMRTVEDYLTRLSIVNETLTGKSLELKKEDAINRPTTLLKDLHAKIANTPRPVRKMEDLRTPTRPMAPETPARFLRTNNHDHNYNNSNNNNNNNRTPFPRREYAPRQAAIEEGYYDMDDSYYAGETSARVAPEPYYPARLAYDVEGEMLFNDEETHQHDASHYPDLSRIMASPGQKALFDPKARKPVDPDKPCYTHFYSRCGGECGGYSHKDEDMVKLRQQQMERLYNSIYGGYEKLHGDLLKLKERPPQQVSPARHDQRHGGARVSAVETQPSNDPSALFGATAQGLGPLPGSS